MNGISEAYHVPTDFVGIPVLSVASIAIGGVAKVAVSATGWTQPLNLYAVSVGVPGSGKAEGLDHIDRPLRRSRHAAAKCSKLRPKSMRSGCASGRSRIQSGIVETGMDVFLNETAGYGA